MTAVELLEKKLKTYLSWSSFLEEDFEQAKQMEKEQISQAYMSGLIDGMNQQPKEYYNETFGNK